ncbi:MAG: type II toxin-antitoxin system RelE/ParE family toxin [Kiritimatiellae bacterium]|jgi:mRNA interferase RelE/StbE|nr:type II toxin-antitoxin system RelE/ParE family toxin [Kiritimatiellia bacterium]
MKIKIRKSAIKDLRKIDHEVKDRLHDKIESLAKFPDVSNIKKLTNFEPAYRVRVGDYRILFDVNDDVIEIGRILHRKDSYQ